MKLIVTIDTEEDNWARYHPTENPVTNIQEIAGLQKLLDEFGVKPTYVVTYPVATHPNSIHILKRILEEGKCEIGMHCHPWNTPPFDKSAEILEQDTMLCNLSPESQHAKLTELHQAISDNFGKAPVSFRTGRWGFGKAVGESLCRLGFRSDSSVTPYLSWIHYRGPDYSNYGPEPFWLAPGNRLHHKADVLLEVPTTVGFLQPNFSLCHRLLTLAEKPVPRKMHIPGILYRLRMLNMVWLSPEQSDAKQMIRLATRMEKAEYKVLNLTFHSTALLAGLSPFVRTGKEKQSFLMRLRAFLVFARKSGYESLTLAEFEEHVRKTRSVRLNTRQFEDSRFIEGAGCSSSIRQIPGLPE